MTRTRQSPGIELNEIDKSQYGKTDYSIVGTTTLMCGVASKGEDYVPQWINSKQTLVDAFGYPATEFERYFYNGCVEILNRGGILLGAKLPYDNESLDRFSYADFSLSGCYYDKSKADDYTLSSSNDLPTFYRGLFANVDAILSSTSSNVTFAAVNTEAIVTASGTDVSPKMTIKELDDYKTGVRKTKPGTFKIVDITRTKYEKQQFYDSKSQAQDVECIGIVPVIVTPIAAMYFQKILNTTDVGSSQLSALQPITDIKRRCDTGPLQDAIGYTGQLEKYLEQYSQKFWSDAIDDYTLSKTIASTYFPSINFRNESMLERKYLNSIGVVVIKAYKETENDNRVKFAPVESFIGSLDKTAKTEKNGTYFIDDIVNGQSQYINFFSNIQVRGQFPDLIVQGNNVPTVLGFTEAETKKKLSYNNTIVRGLQIIFDKLKDPNIADIDTVCDTGVTTIAQRVRDFEKSDPDEDQWDEMIKTDEWFKGWKMTSTPSTWFQTANTIDTFCRSTRKDCIAVIDAPRYFCINDQSKLVRSTDITSTIERDIIPNLKYLLNVNSSYSAGYCNWFQVADDYSGDVMWLPPSIKAAGIYTYTDTYFHKWDAPAGMNRGVIANVIDTAFSPFNDEAGKIYAASWNYAANYPIDGIVLEGQKTFQRAQTALDRVNVRRLVNYLKKRVVRAAKYFLYEGNTAWLRQRFVDTISPIFEDAVNGQGISEYIIKCDDENNTAQTIDRNELHCTIGIRPVKTVEFIVINFVLVNQSASISEMIANV